MSYSRTIRKVKKANNIFINTLIVFTSFIMAFSEAMCSTIKLLNKLIKKHKFIKHTGYNYFSLMDTIEKMKPREFEYFCSELYRSLGYKTKLTPSTNDYGRDIILKKDGKIIFVECKHYNKNNLIGREICQKLLGSMNMFNADAGIIITTSDFHRNAIEVSTMVGNLQLVGFNEIIDMLVSLNPIMINEIIFNCFNFKNNNKNNAN